MDIIGFTYVDGYGLARTRQRKGFVLRFPQLSPRAPTCAGASRCFETSQLHEVEREITEPPAIAPVLDHHRERFPVFICPAGVTLTLVPDSSFDRIRDQWINHGIEQQGRVSVRL